MEYTAFLDDMVPVNMANPMRREDYYKKYIGYSPKGFYDQLIKIEKERNEKTTM